MKIIDIEKQSEVIIDSELVNKVVTTTYIEEGEPYEEHTIEFNRDKFLEMTLEDLLNFIKYLLQFEDIIEVDYNDLICMATDDAEEFLSITTISPHVTIEDWNGDWLSEFSDLDEDEEEENEEETILSELHNYKSSKRKTDTIEVIPADVTEVERKIPVMEMEMDPDDDTVK